RHADHYCGCQPRRTHQRRRHRSRRPLRSAARVALRHQYHQNNATTGTWLNLNRATYPVQLATPRVNAGNAALTPSNVRLAINKVRKSLGINHIAKLIAYMAVEQEHAWENLAITVSQINKEG